MTIILTEDGVQVQESDRVFNYYDHKAGVIRPSSRDRDDWFYVDHDDGTSALLNGSRICSIQFAIRKGWVPE